MRSWDNKAVDPGRIFRGHKCLVYLLRLGHRGRYPARQQRTVLHSWTIFEIKTLKQNPYKPPSAKSNHGSTVPPESPAKIWAFFAGGFGCLGSFLLLGMLAVCLGSGFSLHAGTPFVFLDGKIKINFVGVLVLFLFGGFFWLGVKTRRQRRK